MASGSSSSYHASSSSSSSIAEGRNNGSRRRTIQPPSRFRQSPDKSTLPLPSTSQPSNLVVHHRPTPLPTAAPTKARSKPAPALPLPPTIKIKPSPMPEEENHRSLKLAATENVDPGWPTRHNKSKVAEEDLKDRILMAVCAALASIENKALCLQELSEICATKGWIQPRCVVLPSFPLLHISSFFRRLPSNLSFFLVARPILHSNEKADLSFLPLSLFLCFLLLASSPFETPSLSSFLNLHPSFSPPLSVTSLVSAAIRSHYRRTSVAGRPPLLSKHVLLGSASEIHIAPALHPDSIKADRRPKGTVWFLSSDAGYWNPFERARVSHLLMKDGEGTKTSGVTSKRKREEAAGSSSSTVGPSTTVGGGLKIRLKVLGGLREDDSAQHDVSMGEDLGEGSSSHSRSLGSSSSGADPRLGGGRRQRGPKDGFPDFAAQPDSDDEDDDLSDDQTPTSSLPNHPDSHLHQRSRFVPPKRLQARHSLPVTSSSRSLPASFHGNHRHSHQPAVGDDSDSSSSSEGEDFHEAMLRSDDFAFGMDEDGSGDGSGDTPATTPRDGGVDGLSDQQSGGGGAVGTGKSAASASPPPRRSPFPPAPTPAEVLAGGPVPISADPNHIPSREPVNSLSSSELSDSNLLRHRLATAPHSPVRPFNSDLLHPQSAPPPGSLALPRMQALSPTPSPSPAMPSVLLPHLHSLPSFISHSSPSRLSFHQHLTSGVGSAPNSPSTETKEQEEAFNLTLSLLPTDFKPVIRDHRFGESSGDEFDESESICVIQPEDASPPSDGSGLFDDFGDVGGRENSLARSEDDAHRKAERWAMESSSAAGGIKLEPSSPQMMLMDEETASPREDGFSRDSSREGDDEGGDDDEDEETASGLLAAFRGGDDELMDDEDEVDGTEDFLGPESVGLEELERVWGGGRRGGERCSPFSGSAGGGVFVKMEDVDEDSRMETIEEMKKEKEAFAQALVEKVRAATASMLSPEEVNDEEMEDLLNNPSTSTRSSNSLRPTSSSSSVSKRRVTSNGSNSTSRPTALPPKPKRRDSLLPKPLPAPVRRDFGHKRTNTASMIEMVGMLDVEDFDEMDLLFTPESGIGGRRAGSAARRSESVDASGMSSDVEYLGEGESSSMSGIPPLVDVDSFFAGGETYGGGPSTFAAPQPPVARPLPKRSIFAPRPLDLPAVPSIPQLVQPLKQLSPNVNATCISGIPVFMCFFSNVVLLRRIDSEYVNMSTGLEALAIVGPGEEAKKKEILSPIQDHVVVEWGTSVGSGVNGIWVPLQVARGLALRFTAGSPLLSTFFDLRLANSFPPQLVEAALTQTLRSPSGFAIPTPRPAAPRPISKASSSLTNSKPNGAGPSSPSSKLPGMPRSNASKPSSLSTSSVPSPVAKAKASSPKPKLKAAPTASISSNVATPISTGTSSPKVDVEAPPKLPRTAIATAAKRAKKEAAAAAAAAAALAASSSSTSVSISTKVKAKKGKKNGTPSTTAGLLWDSEEDEEEEEPASRSISPEKDSAVSADAPTSRTTRRTSRVGGSK
ncbi:hypothetical protein BDY24DRAFT_436280 [Mrakia frigida]|uniref:uncharacterized protein n=1 Tax=Mrakia frigida TaxID=29902 RepID=UPI003FCC0008